MRLAHKLAPCVRNANVCVVFICSSSSSSNNNYLHNFSTSPPVGVPFAVREVKITSCSITEFIRHMFSVAHRFNSPSYASDFVPEFTTICLIRFYSCQHHKRLIVVVCQLHSDHNLNNQQQRRRQHFRRLAAVANLSRRPGGQRFGHRRSGLLV